VNNVFMLNEVVNR